jgi:hypothetical protein
LLAVVILIETAMLAYRIPAVHDRLAWRIEELRVGIRDYFYPHPDTLSAPDPSNLAMMQATLTAEAVLHTIPTVSATPFPAEQELPTVTPTNTPARPPVPERVVLPFTGWEKQNWNNCAGASLSMILNFWSWDGDQTDTGSVLKPNWQDKNVMAYEMERYVLEHTDFGVILRNGGTLDDLRSLIAGGFPVVIEKGLTVEGKGWMGHYDFIVGYDNPQQILWTQDSYLGPDTTVGYDSFVYDWRAFNYLYLVVYPWERQQEVFALLGPNVDIEANRLATMTMDVAETKSLEGEPLAFAYFNLGSIHVARYEYVDAAYAFDMARSIGLPWRFLWYQTGPYFAYFYTGRYQDVVDLANETLNLQENLEESWYWRGMARFQLGDRPGAIDDWRQALIRHPGFAPALEQLSALGETA